MPLRARPCFPKASSTSFAKRFTSKNHSMSGKRILIVGANRGIGLNLTKAFVQRSWDVTGSIRPQSRTDPSVKDLEETGARILEIDFLDESTIEHAAREYGDQPLDVLVNVGGLPPNPKAWQENTPSLLSERFSVMALGPFMTIKHFLPNLEKSANGRVVSISSLMGSVTENSFGTCLAYRVGKCALNQVTVTLARDFEREGRNVTLVVMEPGFVPTRLTEYDSVDDMDTCIAGITDQIEKFTRANNGQFIKWSGEILQF